MMENSMYMPVAPAYASRDMAPMSGHYPMIPGEPRW